MRKLVPLLLLICSPLLAQSGVWGSRGVSHAFLVRNNLVFDVDGRGVSVYDVANPASIRRVSVAEGTSESLDGTFLPGGDLAVLTRAGIDRYSAGADGRLALNARYPAPGFTHLRASGEWIAAASANEVVAWRLTADGLQEVRRVETATNVNAIALDGDALIIAIEQEGIRVVDLTLVHDTGGLAEAAQDLVIDGGKLYIAGGVNGLVVADLADPFSPRVIRRNGAGTMNLAHVAVAGASVFGSDSPATIHVFGTGEEIATINEPVQAMAASGNLLFVSGTNFDRFGLATETGVPLRVYDVTTLRVAGEFRDLAGPVSGVATDGTLAYVVDRPYFRVLDVSTTSAPRELASLTFDGIEDHVRLLDKQVILYGRGDVDMIDVSDPYHPRFVKVFHSFGRPPSNAAFTRGHVVEGNPWSGFHVIDFVNYSDALQVGGIKGHYYDVVANGGDVAYVGGEGGAVAAVDLRNFSTPGMTKVIPIAVRQSIIAGDRLAVRALDGLYIYSLADPFVPVETARVPFTALGVIGGNGANLLAWNNGTLEAVDLSSATVSDSGLTVLSPMQIDGTGTKVVVADRYGVRVFGPNTAPPPPPPPPAPPARRRVAGR